MAPDGKEIVRAMTLAIDAVGRRREEIGYVNYHGTSTLLNDAVESRCVRQVFGEHAERCRVVGEVDDRPSAGRQRRGGRRDGGARASIAASSRRRSTSFDPDPECDLDYIPNVGRTVQARSGALQLSGLRVEEQRDCHRAGMTG